MPLAPTLADTKAYLGTGHSWTDAEISAALDAETAAQARVVRFPADPVSGPLPYPLDLREALFRRVVHNLALRGLPLGLQASITDMGVANTRVGGTDAEVRRLESPWRKLAVG